MYKLLVVEDEYLERKLAIELIQGNYPDIFEILESENGKTALKTATTQKPDIMLVDINIPGITGLELIRRIRKLDFSCRIVITTVYDTFAYAQEAVKYGVSDYLLKPLKDSELCKSIEQCLDSLKEQEKRLLIENKLAQGIEKINSYAQKYVFQDILNGNIQSETLTTVYGWPRDGCLNAAILYYCFVESPKETDQESAALSCLQIYSEYFLVLHTWDVNGLCLLLQLKETYNAADFQNILWTVSWTVKYKMLKNRQDCSIWVSKQCAFVKTLSDQIRSGVTDKKKLSASLAETATFQPKLSTKVHSPHERNIKIQKVLWRLKEGKTGQALSLLTHYFSSPNTKWEGLCLLLLAVLQCGNTADLLPALQAMDKQTMENDLLNWLQQTFPCKREPSGSADAPGGKIIVREALRIMDEEYASPALTQTSLAERLGLNPAYFSRLFKKAVGKNFVSVMSEIRIGHAKEFLRSGISPKACAEKCGYTNAKYFYEVFSSANGVSPFQFQRNLREDKE